MRIVRTTLKSDAGLFGGGGVEVSVEHVLDDQASDEDVQAAGRETGAFLFYFNLGLAAGSTEANEEHGGES